MSRPILELREVTKTFPGVLALEKVSFELAPGEVHALVGENGAGKSTLINLVSGVLAPDSGQILLGGDPVNIANPVAARRLGIVAVHQEAELFGTLSIAENLALGLGLPTHRWGLVDWGTIESDARHVVAELGEAIAVRHEAGRLSVGRRQMLNVAAAVSRRAAVLILDEPTSSLSAKETDWLLERIARLKAAGTGIVYVSHRQDEIFALADRITVLRDGRRVWTGAAREIDSAGLIEQMVGRQVQPTTARPIAEHHRPREVRLSVRGLTSHDGTVRGVDLDVAAGEIVGLYGLVGAGRSEAAQTIFGLRTRERGTVEVGGERCAVGRPADAVRVGIAYLPEDRLREGVCRGLSVRSNAVLASLPRWSRGIWTHKAAEREATQREVQSLGVRLRDIEQPIGQLSGGNQQKVVLGRWLLTKPQVLLLDEPTRGVDVAAKREIHSILRSQVENGAAIALISSELPELFEHADRIVVFREGRTVGEFDPAMSTPAEVAACALPEGQADRTQSSAREPLASRGVSNEIGLLGVIGLLAIAMSWGNPQFLAADNLLGILTNVSVIAILALGAAGVIVAGAIDISLGALLALSAAAGGLVLKLPYAPVVTLPAGIAVGVCVGLAGGLLNAGLALGGRIHPIVVTLGTATIYRGLLVTLTGGDTIADLPPEFGKLATARWLGLNGSVLLLLLVSLAMYVLWQQTRAGRHLFALGSSPTAARLVGISARRSWLLAFGCAGTLAGMAGMLELARNGSMQSGMGTGYELRAIAAAVIGGTAITGGRGSVLGVLSGALLLGMVSNALVLWQVSPYRYDVVLGGLLLAAVLVDRWWRRRGGA
jgi:ABC-type sugar transport system ATPase subunit/ribose/xylose/arabinose/galactoside ABC-type transport system permease subunit